MRRSILVRSLVLLWTAACGRHADSVRHDTTGSIVASVTPQGSPTLSPYVGAQIPPYPADVTEHVSYVAGSAQNAQFVIALVRTPEGPMVWLARARAPGERPRVVDVVRVNAPQARETLVGGCRYTAGSASGDSVTTGIYAIAASLAADSLGAIRLAWRVDPKAGRLLPTGAAGLRCREDGTGMDGRRVIGGEEVPASEITWRVLPRDSVTSSDTTYGAYGEEPRIIVVVGGTTIPVGADSSFEELRRELPKPALLPPEDPHDHMHSNDRYCYAFPGGFLVFEDAEGIWRASLMRTAPLRMTACPTLDTTPTIRVGDQIISLGVPPSGIAEQSFPGFRRVRRSAHALRGNWWHIAHVSDGRTWCSQSLIDINFGASDTVLTWISVEAAGEGWAARQRERSQSSSDLIWTCRDE